jgi:parallel beta-helix repeat protein
MKHILSAIFCGLSFTMAFCSIADAATLIVSPGGTAEPRCPTPKYSSIQAAVTAANPGDTVYVCPGVYPEQVVINKALTLSGPIAQPTSDLSAPDDAIIAPAISSTTPSLDTSMPLGPIILVQSAMNVDLVNLTIDGSNNGIGGCGPTLVGILFQNASGTVAYNTVKNVILGSGLGGCQSGDGILIQTSQGGSTSVTIAENNVYDYQKSGIIVNDAGTSASIENNVVTGLGPSTVIAQIGIQLFEGSGKILNNTVAYNIYSPCLAATPSGCPFAAANILVQGAGNNTHVTGNSARASNVGIYVQGAAILQQNTVSGAFPLDGIDLVGNASQATNNTVVRSQSAFYVDGLSNTVDSNIINGATTGLLIDTASSGTTAMPNQFYSTHIPAGTTTRTFTPVLPTQP